MIKQTKATNAETIAALLRGMAQALEQDIAGERKVSSSGMLAVIRKIQSVSPSETAPSAWSPISKTGLLRGIRYGKPTEQDLLIAKADGDTIRYFYEAKS